VYEIRQFLSILFARCDTYQQSAYLTLTAIHPDGGHRAPSRHISLHDRHALQTALAKLLHTNGLGWGSFFAVGLRRADLGRWQRGGVRDVVALPALFADIDTTGAEALHRLYTFQPLPSCIVHSGGGHHLYWLLDQPATDLAHARCILKGLARDLDGDPMSVAQSLRLVGSHNTKPARHNAMCHVVELHDRRYHLHDFDHLLPPSPLPRVTSRPIPLSVHNPALNPDLIRAVQDELEARYAGFGKRNGYIASRCPLGRHTRDHPAAHFNFDPAGGYGHCFGRHGTANLHELCDALGLDAEDYGGVYAT
jgi:hypothetical protein